MKRKYRFISLKSRLDLQSLKHHLVLTFHKKHVEGSYRGRNAITKAPVYGSFKTSIRSSLNQFERRCVAFHILGKIRRLGLAEVEHTNYAEVFMSCFE